MALPKLMTTEEVAEALRMHPKTVRRLANAGKLPCTVIQGRMKFLEEDISNIIYEAYRKY